LPGPFNHPVFKLLGGPSLLTQEPGLLQPHRRLIRGDAQEQYFDLRREILALRAGN
jgi:hypothetical protein